MRKGRRVLNGLLLLLMLVILSACGVTTEDVKTRMEKHLYEKYGEEFVVDRIGQRSANGQKFYQARIYPKSIIGTNKEGDSYYYATANIGILSGGRLRKTGDTYGKVKCMDEAENYLLPKAKEIFGDRIRLKTNPVLEEKDEKNGYYYRYIIPSFNDARKKVKENSEKYRLNMNIYIYLTE